MAQNRMCPNCRAFIDSKEKVCPYCDLELQPRRAAGPPAAPSGGLFPAAHSTTIVFLAINFSLFLVTMVLSQQWGSAGILNIDGRVLDIFGAKNRLAIYNYGQWWRLVSAGFLHGGLLHIAMNSWVLFDLGAQVEHVFGTARFLVIYLVSSVAGFWVSLQINPALSVGASAALCGLIGAMMAYGKRTGQSFVWSFYLRWIIILAVIGFLVPRIDNAAHFGGFAAGFAIGWIASSPRITFQIEAAWKYAAVACCGIAAVSMAFAYLHVVRLLDQL